MLIISLLSSCSSSEPFEEGDLLPDRQAETVADVVKFASIEDLEGLSADKIPGNNSGYEITSLSYECVDTIELRALLLDVTATLKSKSPASGSDTRTVKFSAEVGPELVSVEYVPGGEILPPHDNMAEAFWPHVERYRNYSDGSHVGPDKFFDYGHPVSMSYNKSDGFGDPFYISWEDDLVPYWIGATINPEAIHYENGWYCYYSRCIEKININAVIKSREGETFCGDDFLCIVPAIREIDDYNKQRISKFEKFKYAFYDFDNEDKYDYNHYYSPSRLYSDEDAEYLNMCRNVPDVSVKPFPKDEKSLSTGWYYGSAYFPMPDLVYYLSKYQSSYYGDIAEFFGRDRIAFQYFYLQYLVIDGRIIHFVDLCDYKYLGREVSVTRFGDGYRCHLVEKMSLYGANFKCIEDIDVVPVNGEHIEYDYRDYGTIDEIDNNNKEKSVIGSRSSEPITIYDSGKTIKIDTSLPESVRNISKSRIFNY